MTLDLICDAHRCQGDKSSCKGAKKKLGSDLQCSTLPCGFEILQRLIKTLTHDSAAHDLKNHLCRYPSGHRHAETVQESWKVAHLLVLHGMFLAKSGMTFLLTAGSQSI